MPAAAAMITAVFILVAEITEQWLVVVFLGSYGDLERRSDTPLPFIRSRDSEVQACDKSVHSCARNHRDKSVCKTHDATENQTQVGPIRLK